MFPCSREIATLRYWFKSKKIESGFQLQRGENFHFLKWPNMKWILPPRDKYSGKCHRPLTRKGNQSSFCQNTVMIPYNNLITNLFPFFISACVRNSSLFLCVSVSKLETFTYQLDSEILILLETFQQPFCRLSFLSVLSLYISLYLFSATLLQ